MKFEALAGQRRRWECVGRAQGQLRRHLDKDRRCLQKARKGQSKRAGGRATAERPVSQSKLASLDFHLRAMESC